MIKLFVGLGNPGSKYENTRHNFGFMVLDEIAKEKGLEFKTYNDTAVISFYEGSDVKVALIKPMEFMNNSGLSVADFARYYKIKPEEIFVFYDDFSIPLGEYRIRLSGSDGGHNGIKSLIANLSSDNFPRLKLGIGPKPDFFDTADFVLSRFKDEDKEAVNSVKKKAVEFFNAVNEIGLEKAASKLK